MDLCPIKFACINVCKMLLYWTKENRLVSSTSQVLPKKWYHYGRYIQNAISLASIAIATVGLFKNAIFHHVTEISTQVNQLCWNWS